jgi:hypothetical protein
VADVIVDPPVHDLDAAPSRCLGQVDDGLGEQEVIAIAGCLPEPLLSPTRLSRPTAASRSR